MFEHGAQAFIEPLMDIVLVIRLLTIMNCSFEHSWKQGLEKSPNCFTSSILGQAQHKDNETNLYSSWSHQFLSNIVTEYMNAA
jgi:hypothetical protein